MFFPSFTKWEGHTLESIILVARHYHCRITEGDGDQIPGLAMKNRYYGLDHFSTLLIFEWTQLASWSTAKNTQPQPIKAANLSIAAEPQPGKLSVSLLSKAWSAQKE